MKAICVNDSRDLEVRDIPVPNDPAPGHILVDMHASAINHGDKTFLKMPGAMGVSLAAQLYNVWGASGAGRVVATGVGVPIEYQGKQVAIYRSLGRTPESLGLWCERAQVPHTSCLILPDDVHAKDYCGSLVNVMTAYAFLEEMLEAGHKGVVVTAGNSATGIALAALARQKGIPAINLVRTEAAREALSLLGVEHVIVTDEGFTERLESLAAELGTTAVFDGVGGELLGKIAPSLPMNSTLYCYGFLGDSTLLSLHTRLLMMKNLTLRRFSNFDTHTVKGEGRLQAALKALESLIGSPMLRTRLGKEFSYDQIEQAMAYEPLDGSKAILVR